MAADGTPKEGPAADARVALVTGASAGIGAAVAVEAARRGFSVAVTARRPDRLGEVVAKIDAVRPGAAFAVEADLDDLDAPRRIVQAVLERFGRIDVLVNNAGFGLPSLFADGDPEAIRKQVNVNVTAPMLLARHALPSLRERRGVIVNVGSSITCVPNPALGAYGATKAALAYWSTALRRELYDEGVSVCLVEPGPVKTEFFDALASHAGANPRYHAMLDAPMPWMSAEVGDVARRVVRLFDRPRRRLSVPRRVVWPFRVVGVVYQFLPPLADASVAAVIRFYDRRRPRRPAESHTSRAPEPAPAGGRDAPSAE